MNNWKKAMMDHLNRLPDERTVEDHMLAAAHLLWVGTERKEPGAKLTGMNIKVNDDGDMTLEVSFSEEKRR